MTKDEVRDFLGYLRKDMNVDFSRITRKQALAYINEYADGLKDFSYEETMKALEDCYIPPYATISDMENLLRSLIEVCHENRMSPEERENERQKALEKWRSFWK